MHLHLTEQVYKGNLCTLTYKTVLWYYSSLYITNYSYSNNNIHIYTLLLYSHLYSATLFNHSYFDL